MEACDICNATVKLCKIWMDRIGDLFALMHGEKGSKKGYLVVRMFWGRVYAMVLFMYV